MFPELDWAEGGEGSEKWKMERQTEEFMTSGLCVPFFTSVRFRNMALMVWEKDDTATSGPAFWYLPLGRISKIVPKLSFLGLLTNSM